MSITLRLLTRHVGLQGVTINCLSTCPPGKLHQNCTCLDSWLTYWLLEKVYIIRSIMCPGQKMSLPTRQVADEIYLPGWIFNLHWATGQPLMSHPGLYVTLTIGMVSNHVHSLCMNLNDVTKCGRTLSPIFPSCMWPDSPKQLQILTFWTRLSPEKHIYPEQEHDCCHSLRVGMAC